MRPLQPVLASGGVLCEELYAGLYADIAARYSPCRAPVVARPMRLPRSGRGGSKPLCTAPRQRRASRAEWSSADEGRAARGQWIGPQLSRSLSKETNNGIIYLTSVTVPPS